MHLDIFSIYFLIAAKNSKFLGISKDICLVHSFVSKPLKSL
jgi:hypothetical protein